VSCDGDGKERALPDRDRLPDRSRPPDGPRPVAFRRAARKVRDYTLYVRFDPTLNGNGGGGAGNGGADTGSIAQSGARGFQPLPQDFQFGVCKTADGSARCTFDPTRVPKAMDVLVPTGTTQADELDYTQHQPVVLQPVVIS
jgi:glucoamylase